MATVLDGIRHGARIVVVRLRSLGDCVLTTPALEILKSSRPDTRIAVVVEDRFAEVFHDNPDVTEILSPAVAKVARWKAELCINLHGGSRSAVLTAASGARLRAGFAHFRASGIYNIRIPTAQEILGVQRQVHTAEHLASAMFYLGAERRPVPRTRLFAAKTQSERPYAALHPFAASPEKTWPAERFLEVADYLQHTHNLDPVFLIGPGDDATAFSRYRMLAGASLSEVKSLLAGASLFIGNDSGPAHMAAAFGVPVVVLFGPSDPVIWAPWQVESEVLRGSKGMESIEVHQVLRAADQLRVAQ